MKNLRDLLIQHEAVVLLPYHDSRGKITIGVGRNLSDVGITREEAFYLLDNDIERVTGQCKAHFRWFQSLSEPRRAVVLSMCFNMGLGGLLTFKRFLAYMAEGRFDSAASEMQSSLWADQVGERATALAQMMRDDAWPEFTRG